MPPTLSDSALAETARWVGEWQHRRRVPGVALVVTGSTRSRLVVLSGVADSATRRPLAAEQRWQIGSISKAFTAVALLQLQAAGQLSVDDPVVAHLPWAGHVHQDLTLHHLLTHTGGLPTGSEWSTDSRLETAVQGLVGNPQPPGSGFHYSNCGYEMLGDVVEQVTGVPVEEHLLAHVLRPMGMAGASGSVVAEDRASDVHGHRPPRDDVLWRADTDQVPDQWFPTCTADGSIVATPEDVAVYLRFLISGGAPGVLTGDQFDVLRARHVRVDDHEWYGYGLSSYADRDGPGTDGGTLGHSGGMVGLYADVRVDPALGIGTALLANGHCDVSAANRFVLDRLRADLGAPIEALEPPAPASAVVDDPAGRAEWEPLVGLYRSYNPWVPTVEVVRAGDTLQLADPVSGSRERLAPLDRTRFGVGGEHSPDTATFDVVVEGRYLQLDLSGCRYARVRRRPAELGLDRR